MVQINDKTHQCLRSKMFTFLKRSATFSFLSSTLLYMLTRISFYDYPFTIIEGAELYGTTFLVIWIFILICRLLLSGIAMAENNINKLSFEGLMDARIIAKTILILLTALQAFTGKLQPVQTKNTTNPTNTSKNKSSSNQL